MEEDGEIGWEEKYKAMKESLVGWSRTLDTP
jgi:hypothetical protein